MFFKKFGKRYIIRLEKGEEIIETIKSFCKDKDIKLGIVDGIGAVDYLSIGYFDPKNKEYHSKEFKEPLEILSLGGNISTMDEDIVLHIHITVSGENYMAFGGHLNSAIVSGTCEVTIEVIDGEIERKFNETVGLNLLQL